MTENDDRKQRQEWNTSHLGQGGQAGGQPIQNGSLGQLQSNDEEGNGHPFQQQFYIYHHPPHNCVACSISETFVLCVLRCRVHLMPADCSAWQLCRQGKQQHKACGYFAGRESSDKKTHCNFVGRDHSNTNCAATLEAAKAAAQDATLK